MVREITNFSDDVEQLVVTLFPGNALSERLEQRGIPWMCLRMDSGQSGWNWLPGALRLRKEIRQFRPHVIHSSLASGNLVAQFGALGTGIPVLSTLTLSGDVGLVRSLQPGAGSWKASVFRVIAAFAARRRHVWHRAITQDALSTNVIALGIDASKAVVIPRGVPLGGDRSKPEVGVDNLLNVGRQTAQKGHDHLVAALVGVRERRPTAHLTILGRDGDTSELLETSIAKHDLEDHVTVIQYTPTPYDHYSKADVFVFSSLMEGLGTAVLEAMANGVPVVAYDIPPVREAVGGDANALLVPAGDSQALADGVVWVLENREVAGEMAARAREKVVEGHTVEVVARRLEAVLRRLAESGPTHVA